MVFWLERARSLEYVCIILLPYFGFLDPKLTRQPSWQIYDSFQQEITRIPDRDPIPILSLYIRGPELWHPSSRRRFICSDLPSKH